MEENGPACRVRRILKVERTANGVVTGTVEGRSVRVPADRAARGLVPGDEAVWDGARWVKRQPENSLKDGVEDGIEDGPEGGA